MYRMESLRYGKETAVTPALTLAMTHPILYEINTRPWLRDLSDRAGSPIDLAAVPAAEFDRWEELGFTHIWLMGVWRTGPLSRAQAMDHPDLVRHYKEVLPDWTERDILGSPYAIGGYEVSETIGGEQALAAFRVKLRERGLKLILDFVPNHVGLDHPWIADDPDLFVRSSQPGPDLFSRKIGTKRHWFAHGKDPYFPGWTDTVQLDYRQPETRKRMIEALQSIAGRCDGVRCDMAMLVLNDVFAKTWAHLPAAVEPIAAEFWTEGIGAVRKTSPEFLFLAEVYWGLESRLQALGFDYTYDKILYDRLVHRDYPGVQRHLLEATPAFIAASAHFLENHDEPRIATRLSLTEHTAAALLILSLPGMRFLYEGKLEGSLIFTKVQLGRRPREVAQPEIVALYENLLLVLRRTAVGVGTFQLITPRSAWFGNATHQNFVMVQWQKEPHEFDLAVINLADHRGQCYAPLTMAGLGQHHWEMRDLLGPERHVRRGDDLEQQGLYLDLPAHGAQLFHCRPA